jgi:hypothetical protein
MIELAPITIRVKSNRKTSGFQFDSRFKEMLLKTVLFDKITFKYFV